MERVERITALAGGGEVPFDPDSPTGYAGGARVLVVPEHNNDSYQWIVQTQQMLTRGEWRVRHVDYDNAPSGRPVYSPSPYRWWLGLLACGEHFVSGRPLAASVERAALFSDPLFHLLLLVATAVMTRLWFGALPAAVVSLGWAMLYPLGSAFLPGQPDDYVLALSCAFFSVLPLLAGVHALPWLRPQPNVRSEPGMATMPVSAGLPTTPPSPTGFATDAEFQHDGPATVRRRFILAGIAGGLGLWINVPVQVPLLAGISLGAILAALCARRGAPEPGSAEALAGLPWRAWATAGAITGAACYVIEYFPSHLWGLRLEYNHPLYAVAWWGAGELLARGTASICRMPRGSTWPSRLIALGAVVAVMTVPLAMLFGEGRGFLTPASQASRLTSLADSPVTANVFAWLGDDARSALPWSTLLPVTIVCLAAWTAIRPGTNLQRRTSLALAMGATLVALVYASIQLRWWQTFDAMLLALVVAAIGTMPLSMKEVADRWTATLGILLVFIPGWFFLLPLHDDRALLTLTDIDAQALVERDLAHWLAKHTGPSGAVVLAPPNVTASLHFYGSLRGLGTPHRGNSEGFTAALRIAAATSPDEAQALARRREIAYIVIPSWDSFLDEYARLGAQQPENTLISTLHRWLPPKWLRPVPFNVLAVPGFEHESVVIFETVDVQDDATALSRLAEYFLEMGQLDQASTLGQTLERYFPSELSALVARAQIALAQRNPVRSAESLAALVPYVTGGMDGTLAWDLRVSLAFVLAQGQRNDLARVQVETCLEELDEANLRFLSTGSLHRLLFLIRLLELDFPNAKLRDLAMSLLPPPTREGI